MSAVTAAMTVALGAVPAQAALAAARAVPVPCQPGALAAGIASARGGETLSLAPRCTYVLTAGLPAISQDLTIQGKRAIVERSYRPGVKDFSILTVNPGADLVISDLSFRNGGSGSSTAPAGTAGGAIDNNGNLTVTKGQFTGNSASDGGAILNGPGNLNVRNSVFAANSAINGGAVENNGTMVLSRSAVAGNTASSLGGGVATAGLATVADCSITRNTAFAGGGVWTTVTGLVTSSVFRRNKATAGAGIFNDSFMTLAASQLVGNTAAASGGGLYNDPFGDVTVTGTGFRGNHAPHGGGMDNEDVAALAGSQLSGNVAGQIGGGIYTDWVLQIANSKIVRNTAATGGGGIYNDDNGFGSPGVVSLSDAELLGNQPDNCAGCEIGSGLLRLRPRVRRMTVRDWPGGRPMTGFAAAAAGRKAGRR